MGQTFSQEVDLDVLRVEPSSSFSCSLWNRLVVFSEHMSLQPSKRGSVRSGGTVGSCSCSRGSPTMLVSL